MTMKAPALSAQVSSCDSAFSFDSSDLNSTSNSEAMLLNHEYADPVELQNSIRVEMEKIDHKRKKNLIYEPTTTIKQKNANPDKASKCSLRNWCVVFVFLISSCALALSLLVTLGIVATKSCCLEEENKSSSTKKLVSDSESLDGDSEKIIKELQAKVSSLNDQIPRLMQQVSYLQSKVDNQTIVKGPKGDIGPPGPPGAGDLSKCRYKTEAGTVSYLLDHPEKTVCTTGKVSSDDKLKIFGATCSTLGGKQFRLISEFRRNKRLFWCKCGGKSTIEPFTNPDLVCRLHYWVCPNHS